MQSTQKYSVKCKRLENKYKFNLKASLTSARNNNKWLRGYTLWFPRNIDPDYEDMHKIVRMSGGKVNNVRKLFRY